MCGGIRSHRKHSLDEQFLFNVAVCAGTFWFSPAFCFCLLEEVHIQNYQKYTHNTRADVLTSGSGLNVSKTHHFPGLTNSTWCSPARSTLQVPQLPVVRSPPHSSSTVTPDDWICDQQVVEQWVSWTHFWTHAASCWLYCALLCQIFILHFI